ncbi:protein CDV3 homolog [Daktulosphaira vitifoliae]|uniref:protein CDV3 homolog n=1 Tax=Daktulosphaira vitifoliae TaxID=58002 RepID=UPI0021A9ECE0|nr:protein CDV3 homolog [Daktulosphaira vitifoliae]XP_050530471.1 protein CDV3 homolog [Daktulosphaira vitifoliae]
MADLDSFFAKKDRKKPKGKKFTTSEHLVASLLDEPQKKQEKSKKERSNLTQLHNSGDKDNNASQELEEEWKEYQEEIKDYTTLKIQNLTTDGSTNCSDSNDKDDTVEFEENEAGEMVPKRKQAGPWKVAEAEIVVMPKDDPITVEKPEEPKKNVYVIPNQRSNFQGPRSVPKSRTSLDVKDEEMFPTLQGNTTKKVAPVKKAETPAWSKYS